MHAHLLVLSYISPVTRFRIPRILNGSAHSEMGLSTSIKLLPTDPAHLHLLNEDISTFMSFLGAPMSLIGITYRVWVRDYSKSVGNLPELHH